MSTKVEKVLTERLQNRKALFALRNSLERFISRFEPETDSCQVPVRLETFDRLNNEFIEIQDAIEKLDAPEALDAHLDERVDFETRYCVAKGFLLSKRAGPDPNQSLNATTAANSFFPSSFAEDRPTEV